MKTSASANFAGTRRLARAEPHPQPREDRREEDHAYRLHRWNHDDGNEKPKSSSRV